MKNVTLSIPDDLLAKSREYAAKQGTSLNQFIREMLKMYVKNQEESTIERLLDKSKKLSVKTKTVKWNRDEIYDRKIFS